VRGIRGTMGVLSDRDGGKLREERMFGNDRIDKYDTFDRVFRGCL
jgi:hypothetical protein